MIGQTDILTAINKLLVDNYPEHTVYVNTSPDNFERPSFLLEFIRLSQRDRSYTTIEKTVYITITIFTSVDQYYFADKEKLALLQDQIMDLFSKGYIKVKDRAIGVKSSSGGMGDDRAYIDLQFEYCDSRFDSTVDEIPMMSSIKIKYERR